MRTCPLWSPFTSLWLAGAALGGETLLPTFQNPSNSESLSFYPSIFSLTVFEVLVILPLKCKSS
jgi:hypothetical protein